MPAVLKGFAATLLALALCLAPTASAQEQPAAAADPVAGCYRLEHAPWPEGLDHLQDPARIPERLELTLEPYKVGRGLPDGSTEYIDPPGLEGARVVRYPGQSDWVGPFRYWKRLDDGSLLLDMYLSPGGFRMRVLREGEDLVGELIGSTDFIPPDRSPEARVPARLVREACDERAPAQRPR